MILQCKTLHEHFSPWIQLNILFTKTTSLNFAQKAMKMLKFSKLSIFFKDFKESNFQKQVNLLTYHMISILNNKVVYHSLCPQVV